MALEQAFAFLLGVLVGWVLWKGFVFVARRGKRWWSAKNKYGVWLNSMLQKGVYKASMTKLGLTLKNKLGIRLNFEPDRVHVVEILMLNYPQVDCNVYIDNPASRGYDEYHCSITLFDLNDLRAAMKLCGRGDRIYGDLREVALYELDMLTGEF